MLKEKQYSKQKEKKKQNVVFKSRKWSDVTKVDFWGR